MKIPHRYGAGFLPLALWGKVYYNGEKRMEADL